MKKWNHKRIIDELKFIVKKLGRIPPSNELKSIGRTDLVAALQRYFRSYKNALISSNIPYNKVIRPEKWTKERVIRTIKKVANKLKRTPSRREIIKYYGDSIANATRRHFGSWNNAIIKCELKPNPSGCSSRWRKWYKDTIIKKLKEIHTKSEHTPTVEELESMKLSGMVMACRRIFGSFSNALREAGLEPNEQIIKNDYWKIWEIFVIKIVKLLYPSIIIKKKIQNTRLIPDITIPSKNFIIEIKTNLISYSVLEDIRNYTKYGNLQIWYLKGDPNFCKILDETKNVDFVGPERIQLILDKFEDPIIDAEFEQVKSKLLN